MLNKQYDAEIHSSLPKEWFKDSENATFFGRPSSEYSFEEMTAIAAHGWKLFQKLQLSSLAERKNKCVELQGLSEGQKTKN